MVQYLQRYRNAVSDRGLIRGTRFAAYWGYIEILQRIGKSVNFGESPLEKDWDILVILDACRCDLFREAIQQHSIRTQLNEFECNFSNSSGTPEWIEKNFNSPNHQIDLARVGYISASGFSSNINRELGHIEHVWKYGHDQKIGTVPPQLVTDVFFELFHSMNAEIDKWIIHYIQPHSPFIRADGKFNSRSKVTGGDGSSQNVWRGLQNGNFNHKEVWHDYKENLIIAFEEVEKIITCSEGKILVTSDHGNGLGEFGVYGHPNYVPIPSIKNVPWATFIGNGTREYENRFDIHDLKGGENTDRIDHLKDLGYF